MLKKASIALVTGFLLFLAAAVCWPLVPVLAWIVTTCLAGCEFLVRGADRADNVAAAMRTRGFDGHFHTLTAFRTTAADVLAFLTLLAATIALVAWDRLGLS